MTAPSDPGLRPDAHATLTTAEALMRSRFAAFAAGHVAHLLATWHPSTRPAHLDLTENPEWRALQIVDTVGGGPDDTAGVVEFRASYRDAEGGGVLHERSRFVREGDLWFYVDGDLLD